LKPNPGQVDQGVACGAGSAFRYRIRMKEQAMVDRRANELLGYPADARLLIVNCDDFGMYHAINEAIVRGLTEGVARSTTVMTPCPWGLHALHLLGANPGVAFGVHLTLVCDYENYTWGPVAARERVPSLVDETGHFYRYERIPELLAKATVEDLDAEFRAQIEVVLSAGLKPTHLDWHCLYEGGRPDIFDLTVRLAREYGLAVRVNAASSIERLQGQGLPTNDYDMMDSYRLETAGKTARYLQMLRELPEGLTEWAVHPGLDYPEARAIDPGWPVRYADFAFVVSAEARETVSEEGIVLLDYRALQVVWNG
jgi:chitin disaccharide deacetylase